MPHIPPLPASPSLWPKRRLAFNILVLLSTALAICAYAIIFDLFKSTILRPIANPDGTPSGYYDTSDDGAFGILPCCCGPFLLIALINLLYLAGPPLEHLLRSLRPNLFTRHPTRLWWVFTTLICAPPWIIPLLLLVLVTCFPNTFDHTPVKI